METYRVEIKAGDIGWRHRVETGWRHTGWRHRVETYRVET